MKDLKISKKPRTYIPAELNIQWENLEPIFNELINRPLNSVNDLEQWLRDRSEIEAALEEDFAWRYIRMTCDTTDEKLLTDFQFFATEIEPKISPLHNELNKKFIQSPFAKQLNAYIRKCPFDKMFYMILNLAYGGSWGGQQGVDDTKLPHKFYIDYVRVYQMQESTGPFSINVQPPSGGTVEISPKMDLYPEGTIVTVTAKPDAKFEFDKWLHVGASNPMQFTVSKDITLVPLFKKRNELILNGDFSLGIVNWGNIYLNNSTTMAASPSVTDGVYSINVTKPGTAGWHIVEQQGNIYIEKGVSYLVTFDAWADNPGAMDVFISKNHDDYSGYYSTIKNISTVKQSFTWTFKMLQTTDPNCRFGFGVGKFTGKVFLDNVSIEKQLPTGSEEYIASTNGFEIYPNPASNYLDIINKSNKTQLPVIKLFNLSGQLVSNLSSNQVLSSGQKMRIDLNNDKIGNGIYLINISTFEKSVTHKLVINRP